MGAYYSNYRSSKQRQQSISSIQVASEARTPRDLYNEDNIMAANDSILTELRKFSDYLSTLSSESTKIRYLVDNEHKNLDRRIKQAELREKYVTDKMRTNAELHTTTKLKSSEDYMSPANVPTDYEDFFVQTRTTAIDALQEKYAIKEDDEVKIADAYVYFGLMFEAVWHIAHKKVDDMQNSVLETFKKNSLFSYDNEDTYKSELQELERISKEQFSVILKRSGRLMKATPIVSDLVAEISNMKATGKMKKYFDEQIFLKHMIDAADLCLRMVVQTPMFEIRTHKEHSNEQYSYERHTLVYFQQGKSGPKQHNLYNIKCYTKPMLFRDGQQMSKGEVILEENTMNNPNATKDPRQIQTEDPAMSPIKSKKTQTYRQERHL